jgi:hypothetical protein
MELEWITPQDAALLWGISERRIQSLCTKGRVDGATKLRRVWLIPKNAPKPIDGRTRAAKQAKRQR